MIPTSIRPTQRPVRVVRDPGRDHDRVVFDPVEPAKAEPVRIFLGTEPAQWRAERVFLWSVARWSDPARGYEVHRLCGLPGFDRRGWTTGFTNYRFAIPELAGGRGRAIYNDVDQIYLTDPAELFDQDLGSHGFLAVGDRETSVMLIDCARMRELWNLDSARRRTKKALQAAVRGRDGLWGPLEPRWNARDAEYDPEHPGVLHYTTLHTQPWRPFPDHFVYDRIPEADVWQALEREADEADFRAYRDGAPSGRFREWLESPPGPDVASLDAASVDAFGRAGGVARVERWGPAELRAFLAGPAGGARVEALACAADWESLPPEDRFWVLDRILGAADRMLYVAYRSESGGGTEPHTFGDQLAKAAARHPRIAWHLRIEDRHGARTRAGGCSAFQHRGEPPRVWVLTDDRAGNSTQSLGLAAALGWAYEEKPLRFGALSKLHNQLLGASYAGLTRESRCTLGPPWPDVVISAGRRNAPVARAIRESAHGLPRIIQLGRKGSARASDFDVAISLRAAGLRADPRRIETHLPLCRIDREALAREVQQPFPLTADACRPRVALLVGGATGRCAFGPQDASDLAAQVRALMTKIGGSLFVSTSRRTGEAVTEVLARELPDAQLVYRWVEGDPNNPYRGLITNADVLIVTGDSESMLSEAAAMGVPLLIAPLRDVGAQRWRDRVGERIVARARRTPANERGTPRPQQGLERLCARLVDSGWVRPIRDLDALHHHLVAEGYAAFLSDAIRDPALVRKPGRALREAEDVAARVRQLVESGAVPAAPA